MDSSLEVRSLLRPPGSASSVQAAIMMDVWAKWITDCDTNTEKHTHAHTPPVTATINLTVPLCEENAEPLQHFKTNTEPQRY